MEPKICQIDKWNNKAITQTLRFDPSMMASVWSISKYNEFVGEFCHHCAWNAACQLEQIEIYKASTRNN